MTYEEFSARAAEHVKLVSKRESLCKTEEASKTSLILPFFKHVLGYDVDDPAAFIPEYVADIGVKKGEKVDYAIMKNDKPIILIEAKWNGYQLDGFVSQLFRYFSVTSAQFGILTNGVTYRFYGDLDANHLMDQAPFREIDLHKLTDSDLQFLWMFHQSRYSPDKILSAVNDMNIRESLQSEIDKLLSDPDNDFVGFIAKRIQKGRNSKTAIQGLQPLVKEAIDNYVHGNKAKPIPASGSDDIITTQEEIEFSCIIKSLLHDKISANRLVGKDLKSYYTILVDGISTKWLCRFYPVKGGQAWTIYLPKDNPKQPEKISIESPDDLYGMKDRLISALTKYI